MWWWGTAAKFGGLYEMFLGTYTKQFIRYLVTTKAHLFVRLDGDTDCFNVEATGKGVNRLDDNISSDGPFRYQK